MRPAVFGHGDETDINTLPSFARCRDLGADGVEFDVRLSADGELVVIHDAVLADGRAVAETARADLPDRVPALADVLDASEGLVANIEIKNFPRDPAFDPSQRVTHLVCDLLERRGGRDRVLISCFDFACIDLIHKRAPHVATAMLYLSRRPAPELLDPVVAHGHRTVHPYDTMVDEAFMDEARARDLEVNVWVEPIGTQRLQRLVELGVDGLITSEVAAACQVVERRLPNEES